MNKLRDKWYLYLWLLSPLILGGIHGSGIFSTTSIIAFLWCVIGVVAAISYSRGYYDAKSEDE
ncbi:hypothetical protein [Vibrio harveyi]|uniref:hypothetical protein n=1 Tax=Vibrio harveyi TaxID=669 RepID=UPI003CF91016